MNAKSVVKVVYIGAKAVKHDNVLNRKHLSWHGFGSVQSVPEEDAEVYFRFPTVWCDEDTFAKSQKLAAAAVKPAKGNAAPKGDGDAGGGDEGGAGDPDGSGDDKNQSQSLEGADRETLVQAAILQLKKSDPNDYTTQGKPRVNRINEIVGTNVGAEEIDHALKTLKHTGKL